jgi:hypothetical protein
VSHTSGLGGVAKVGARDTDDRQCYPGTLNRVVRNKACHDCIELRGASIASLGAVQSRNRTMNAQAVFCLIAGRTVW